MKTKVEITEETAKLLMEANVPVECRYYMYAQVVEDRPKMQISVSEPVLKEVRKKKPRAVPLIARARPGCFFVLSKEPKILNNMLENLTPGLRTHMAYIISYLLEKGPATRKEIAEVLAAKNLTPYSKNPYGTALTYVSRAYQLGIIKEKS